MNLTRHMPAFIALVLGIIFALLGAMFAANAVESKSHADVSRVLELNGHTWPEVTVDGLQVVLSGTAPDEAGRFRALKAAGAVIDATRLIDGMSVAERSGIEPPRFTVEILRNDDGISLIGLIPESTGRDAFINSVRKISKGAQVVDLLDTADFPKPDGWATALAYGISALADLPRSKISIGPNSVLIKAISDSAQEKRRLETKLLRRAPAGLMLVLDVTAPRPVISPYTLRFIIDDDGPRFDACSTFTPEGRDKIIAAAQAAGLHGSASCTLGLGIPSPTWDDAVILAIGKLQELGGGSVTFSNVDVTLVAVETTPQSKFDDITATLKSSLPDAFSLHAILPKPVVIDGTDKGEGPPEFIATRSPEGDVRLRGRIPDDRTRVAVESFAFSLFGSDVVTASMRIDPDLPTGWSTRILASLEALGQLNSGVIVTQPDVVDIRGLTGNPDAKAEVARILSEKLGASENYRIAITYQEQLDELANIPTPQECVDQINNVLSVQKIVFTPSSADIDQVARVSIDNIAEIMKTCLDVEMEIGGHTDSQGRETMNLALSQSRASSVVNALLARRILTSNLTAKGYGETLPIADNKTEVGREANRRIEFRLIILDAAAPEETTPAPDSAEIETQQESADEQN
ncbi:MAG: OmpA family protein [Paracoccaceae bacterium]